MAGSKSSPCLSAVSLGCVPRCPRSAGDRRGCIAAVPRVLRLSRHAAQTRYAQTWAALRPRQAPVLGSLYGSIRQRQRLKAEAEADPCQIEGVRTDVAPITQIDLHSSFPRTRESSDLLLDSANVAGLPL